MILKPMNVGEILDNSLALFMEQFRAYLAIVALGVLSVCGLGIIVALLAYLLSKAGPVAFVIGMFILIALFIISVIAICLAMKGGLIKKASEQICDREINTREVYRFGFYKAFWLFLAGLLVGLIVSFGTLFCLVPGIYLFVLLFFFEWAVIIDDAGPIGALQKSADLVAGSWWRCLGILLLIYILVWVLQLVLRVPLSFLGEWLLFFPFPNVLYFAIQLFIAILSVCIAYLFMPLPIIATTLLYYDLKVRKENLDVHLMVDNLTGQSSGTPPENLS